MKYITIGSIFHHTFYPLYASVFCIIRTYSFSFFSKENNFNCPLLFEVLLMFFGMFLAIFLEMISVVRLYRENRMKHYFRKICELWKYQILLFFLPILDLSEFIGISILFLSQNYNDNRLMSTTRMLEFLFVGFMYYYFLKQKLHRHHFIPLLFIAFGLIMVMFGQDNRFRFSPILLLAVLGNLLYAVLEIIEKWLMESKYFSPYDLVYLTGLYGFIIMFIICLISSNINCTSWLYFCKEGEKLFSFTDTFGTIFTNKYYFIEVMIYVLTSTGYNVFFHLVNKHFGPTHHVISDAFSSMVVMMITIITSKTGIIWWLQILGHIFIVCGTLIYNEIIIIHAYGLDRNTTDEIIKRASDEEEKERISILKMQLVENQEIPNNRKDKIKIIENDII